ncbi:hypothetical protein KUTeg_005198 [Tegillarca granosa]|uniref:C2 DOCK-type domain-containing protein n=1 Tax=Tegillarca granosa TaxID=220873 RepID=A0ABQ9FJ41_TEGGR|nr:hypothetical protein KUTeg_005198 [Tegillarca granosa]
MLSEYKSLIYYHEDKPKWFETVKVAISTEEEFKGLHLKFFFKHKSTSETKDKNDKAFAMSFVKLMNKNGTTLSDTDHNLLVYKIEDKKGDKSAPYLDLPSTREDLEEQDIGKGNKFLQDLLDSLFSILMQNTISDMHDNQVFEALVYIIGLISDRKYQQFRPVLDAYVKTSFSFALAYQ